MEALLKMRDVEMMKRELSVMDQVHETAMSMVDRCVGILAEDKIKDEMAKLKEIGEKMFQIKREVLEWLKNLDDEESTVYSRSSRRSGGSRNSRKSAHRREKANSERHQDQLIRTLNERKQLLEDQKTKCKSIVGSKENVKQEIQLLEKTHQEAISKAILLEGFLPQTGAREMAKWVEEEKDEIVKIKQWMIKNVASEKEEKQEDEVENKSQIVTRRYQVEEENSKEEEKKKEKEDSLKKDVSKIRNRLSKQKEIIKDLLKTNDSEMMNRELECLDKMYDDLVAAASQLRKVLDPGDALKELSNTIDAEDSEVFEVKKSVAEWRIEMTGKEGKKKIENLNDSKEVIALREEVKALKKKIGTAAEDQGEGDPKTEKKSKTEVEEMESLSNSSKKLNKLVEETMKKKSSLTKIENDLRAEEEGEKASIEREKEQKDAEVKKMSDNQMENEEAEREQTELLGLNKLMVEALKMQAAPKVEIDSFSGDPLEYNYFIETFKDVVESAVSDQKQRLIRLLNYTNGEAKELIKHCVHDHSNTGYKTALKLLKQEYGNPVHIACAHLEKLKSWPTIKTNDAIGLKNLHRFLLKCAAFQKIAALDLDSPLLIRNVQLVLPMNLQDKWTSRAGRIRKTSKKEATFSNFVEFIEEESSALNDPIYSRGGFEEKRPDDRFKVNKTDVQECIICKAHHDVEKCPKVKALIQKEEEGKRASDCPACKEKHDLDFCQTFKAMEAKQKKELLFSNKLCFACYGKSHRAKDCVDKRACATCQGDHPTGLHGVTFKVHVVHEGGGEGSMCIVPVRLWHKNTPGKELEVYAMLDECSTGTFIDEEVMKFFENDLDSKEKRPTTIRITTATNKEGLIAESCAVTGLMVKAGNDLESANRQDEIELPVSYAKEGLPMDKEDIPRKNVAEKWTYLKELAKAIPEVKDIPFGLLIGNNCPRALEPIQLIPGQNNGPYAKRTRLGWCVVGTAVESQNERMVCNVTKLEKVSANLGNKTSTTGHRIVTPAKIKDTNISETLEKMWKTDFIEKQAENRAFSKEDKAFMKIMRENVEFEDGHYILPLPIKTGKRLSEEIEKNEDNIEIISPQDTEREKGKTDQSTSGTKTIKQIAMPENREQAIQRIKSCRKRMLKDTSYKNEYWDFMRKLFDKGYTRRVPEERLAEKAWYLPHHGVKHPMKKKIRVVFNCSQEKEGVSLNKILMQGPDFMNSLLRVLLRFRKGSIPLMADIESMYYQVRVPDKHCKFMRFFWWEDEEMLAEPIEHEMCVHSFGAVSSKNCVIFALHQTATDQKATYGEEAAEALEKDFYMDDLLKSLDSLKEVIEFVKNVNGMCAAGGFNLTKFICGDRRVIETIPIEKRAEGLKEWDIGELPTENALGVKWNVENDTLGFRVSFETDNGTRRGCLATVSRFHDPLGAAAPFLLRGKKILQKMTKTSTGWDEELDPKIAKEWNAWKEELMLLADMQINRCYRKDGMKGVTNATLHCFSDASFVGYGVACYLRLVDREGKVEVALVMGKSRVSPLKLITVPRLELVAAVVLVQIAAMLKLELKITGLETFYWIDNKVVLGYILNETRRYRVFVANRVQVIDSFMKEAGEEAVEKWKYIETKDNPADHASRGISPKDTEKVDFWLNGPKFLREPGESWREKGAEIKIEEEDPEVKCNATTAKVVQHQEVWEDILGTLERRISSWYRMKRVIVWVMRFVKKSKETKQDRNGKSTTKEMFRQLDNEGLTVESLDQAEKKIIWLLQEKHLKEEKDAVKSRRKRVQIEGDKTKKRQGRARKSKDRLGRLNPLIDEEGIMRVGGRLGNAEEEISFKFPAIIPKEAECTRRMIEWHHKQVAHRGKHTTVCKLRESGFWVINSSKEVGRIVFHCVRCRWLRGKFGDQLMANLPFSRTTIEPPFTYCGVDLFGPIEVKEGRRVLKRYGVLFTCFSLRAVHIELAASLETDSFIQALRRFIGRRGAVREIISDKGTNFVGADNELREAMEEMDHQQIRAYLNEQGGDWIRWERNTPRASHMGGVWERQVRTVKNVLVSIIKGSPRRLEEETLRTLLTEAEAIVNSRPLTLENLHDPESTPLSPNQLLTMKTRLVSPPPGVFQKNDVYCRKRWRVTQHLANVFWDRWRKEYLQLQQSRQKWTEEKRNLMENDVVLLKEDGVKRAHWPMARVVEAHKSEDGLVRSVSLQKGNTVLKRPVNKTVLLVPAKEKETEHQNRSAEPRMDAAAETHDSSTTTATTEQ